MSSLKKAWHLLLLHRLDDALIFTKLNQVLGLEWENGAVCDYFSHRQQSLAASQTKYSLKERCKIFQKSRNNCEILGFRRVACSKFHREDPQKLGTALQNLFTTLIWLPGFVHPCITVFIKVRQVRNTLNTSSLTEVKWSELRWSSCRQSTVYIRVTFYRGYFIVFYFIWCVSCTVVVLARFLVCGWMYMGVFWQLYGCFGNMCTCIYCVLYCLYCVFVLFPLCILLFVLSVLP